MLRHFYTSLHGCEGTQSHGYKMLLTKDILFKVQFIVVTMGRKKSEIYANCNVCGEIINSYLSYGALACASCRVFFRRQISKSGNDILCFNGGQCEINEISRTFCQNCRFQKSLVIIILHFAMLFNILCYIRRRNVLIKSITDHNLYNQIICQL